MTGLLVLDDDPTGTQLVADVPVVLDWSDRTILADLRSEACVYALTNTRSLEPDDARRYVTEVVDAFQEDRGFMEVVLRGDSTLRGHMLPEYLGWCDARSDGGTPPYVLVPALPSAGRVTVGGMHLIEVGGERRSLAGTEYSRDPVFGYQSSHLVDWAEERSAGFFSAAAGLQVDLCELRQGGPSRISRAISELAGRGLPAVLVPDAEVESDLQIIAAGLRLATSEGVPHVVRSGPALAAVMSGHASRATVEPDATDGLLIICGSHVPTTTRQLALLEAAYPGTLIEADLAELDSPSPEREIARLAAFATASLANQRVAVVATPRSLDHTRGALTSSRRIATNLAAVITAMEPPPKTVLTKGGITSAVVAKDGVGGRRAMARGPVANGVALWDVYGTRGVTSLLVFPGNVGDDDALRALVSHIIEAGQPRSQKRR